MRTAKATRGRKPCGPARIVSQGVSKGVNRDVNRDVNRGVNCRRQVTTSKPGPRSKQMPVPGAGVRRRPGPLRPKSKMSLSAGIESEDTICIICSKLLPADPVSIVLQNSNSLSKSLSVFCEVMEMDKETKASFDFSKEKFPFCRPCGFAVDEMEEISDEISKLQERMDNIKAKCCVKILESCNKKEAEPVSSSSPDLEVSGRYGSSSQFERSHGIDKVQEMRNSIVTRFRPNLILEKVDDLSHLTGGGSELNSIRSTNRLCPIPVTVETESRGPPSPSSITNIYEDEEIKTMLRQLVDCVSSTSSISSEHEPGDYEDMAVALQDENYLMNSLNSALIATRDAWINDYLAQLFATTYSNLTLWGSESMDIVQVEYDDYDGHTEEYFQTEMKGEFYAPEALEPLSPKPILMPCHHCDRGFKTQRSLRIHVFKFHGEGQLAVFKCKICAKTYIAKIRMKRHLEKSHNLDPQVTPLQDHFTKEMVTGENTNPRPCPDSVVESALNMMQPSVSSKSETQITCAQPVNNTNSKESSSVLRPVVRLVRLNLDEVMRNH